MTLKAQSTTGKIDKLEFQRIYNSYVSKDTKEVERQHREWRKYL